MVRVICGIALLAATLCARNVSAQVATASVYGHVSDPSGLAVGDAAVVFTNNATGVAVTAATDDRGEFALTFIPVGRYTLTVVAAGFATYERTDLGVSAGQTLRLTISLAVSGVAETVSVSAGAPRINRANPQLQTIVDDTQLRELPLAARDWTKAVELDTAMVRVGTGVVMNGLPPSALTLTVDGTNGSSDAERPALGPHGAFNIINSIGTESIEEVSVSSGIASAEFGGTMAGNVNIITRGGSNAFHGSLFEQHQRDELDASNPFVATTPERTYDQFGGSFGGPILRNRAFFFGAYEAIRSDRMGVRTASVPTPDWRAEALAANPIYESFFALFPAPTASYAPGARTASFVTTRPETRRDDDLTARVDVTLSPRTRLNGRYSGGRPYQLDPRALEANPRTFDSRRDTGTFVFTRTGASWIAETRAGFNWNVVDRVDELYVLGLPSVSVQGTSLSSGELFHKEGQQASLDYVIATTRGRHALKLGANILHQRGGRSNFNTPSYSYSTIPDFYANIPSTAQYTFGLDQFQLRATQFGGFIQDDIRLGGRLMLNLGVRYDYFTVPEERDGRLFNRDAPWGTGPLRPPDRLYNADYNNISPRVGFAWAVDQRAVVRGGFGVFVNPHPLYGGPVDLVLNGPDEQYSITLGRQDVLTYGFRYPMSNDDAEPLVQGPAARWGNRSIASDFPNPYSLQWTVTAAREIGTKYSVEVGYVGTRGKNLNTVREINQPDRLTGVAPYPGFAVFGFYDASNSSTYDGLNLSFRRRHLDGLSFGAMYTYSRSRSYGAGDLLHEDRPQESFNLAAEYGPSKWDAPHRLAAHVIYEVPTMGSSALVRGLVGGWQVSGILAARSGLPLNVTDGSSSYRESRPDRVGGDLTVDDWRDSPTLQYLNRGAFERVPIAPASGAQIRAGTLGWNAVRLPSFFNLDLGLARTVSAGRYRVQVRVDLFNALNTRNYGGLNTNISNSNFGRFTSVSSRTMQLGARFSF